MASGPPSDARKPINPYEASYVAESQEAAASQPKDEKPRTYRICMKWADRRRFLGSVGLLRLGAVTGAVMGFYGVYGLLTNALSSWGSGTLGIWFEPVMAGRWMLVVLKAILGFYACWLQWTLAEALQVTAGGASGSMQTWSIVQRRIATLAVIVLAVNAFSMAWDWVTMQFIATGLLRN